VDQEPHLLLQLTRRLPVSQTVTDPPIGVYDEILGLWMDQVDGNPVVYDPNRPKPETKKCDVETGEDHKGT